MKSSNLKPPLIPTRPILWSQEEQECNIKLGSWTQDGDVVNLTLFNNKVLLLMIILVLNIFMLNNDMIMLDITLFNSKVLILMIWLY